MSDIVLEVKDLYKQYRLGTLGSATLRDDLSRWWAKLRGKEDPTRMIGEENSIKDVGGKYVWALQGINIQVKKGEVLGIVGKNGAGKSTLLKILSKITGPTQGTVNIKGRIASLLEVGTGFHPELSGRENIFLNGAILGMTKTEIRSKLDEIIAFAGIAKYIDTPVKRYSSGMRVRLGFAVAAYLEPEILVVDEVLAVGDAEFQKKAIGKMKDVSTQEGRTVLFVSHNMAAINDLCHRVVMLKDGKIAKEGDTKEVVAYYLESTLAKNISQDTSIDDPSTRRGNGAVRFNYIQMLDSEGLSRNRFEKGEELTFQLSCILNKPVEELLTTIYFRSGISREVVTTIPKLPINLVGYKPGDTIQFTFYIPSINLRAGTYELYYWLGSQDRTYSYDTIDALTPPLIVKDSRKAIFDEIGYFDLNVQFKQRQFHDNNNKS